MRFRHATALVAAAALAAGGCGGGDDEGKKIPADTRAELEKQLASIEDRFDAGGGACTDIAENQQIVAREIDGLGETVDPEVRRELTDGFDRLFELTAEQCDEQKGQETETTPTETIPEPPPDTETTPTETETAPPEETAPQEEEGDGADTNGKGKGNGNGGGGAGGGVALPDADGDGGAVAP